MLYMLIGVVSLAVGLLGNRYFSGSGYGLVGDLAFALAGGAGMAALFRMTAISTEVGMYGALVFAAIGAGGLLLVRRSLGEI
ncbi:MAG: hypothetical protein AMJ64_09920 [Betaproteobacteria bacterium SG8_39]|nr:MAG: hypothetical protein AMJ64_09920 [Betaproteobacteria bacterium SG8_39]